MTRHRHVSTVSGLAYRAPSSAPMKPELHITTRATLPEDHVEHVTIPVCISQCTDRGDPPCYR